MYDSASHVFASHDFALHDFASHDFALHDFASHDSALYDFASHDFALYDSALHDLKFSYLPSLPLHFRLLGSHLGFPGKHFSHLRLPESSFLFFRHVIVAAFACLLSTFRFSGKHFPPLLLAWIPFSSLKQAFPTSFTCLDSFFISQASISHLFYLPIAHFPLLRQSMLFQKYCLIYKKSFRAVVSLRTFLSRL